MLAAIPNLQSHQVAQHLKYKITNKKCKNWYIVEYMGDIGGK